MPFVTKLYMEIWPFYSLGPQGGYLEVSWSILPCITLCPLICPKTVKIPALKGLIDTNFNITLIQSKKLTVSEISETTHMHTIIKLTLLQWWVYGWKKHCGNLARHQEAQVFYLHLLLLTRFLLLLVKKG